MKEDKKIPGVNYSGPRENEALWHDFAGRYIAAEPDLRDVRVRALNILDEIAFGSRCVREILEQHVGNEPFQGNPEYKLLAGDLYDLALEVSDDAAARKIVMQSVAEKWASVRDDCYEKPSRERVGAHNVEYKNARSSVLQNNRESNFLFGIIRGGMRGMILRFINKEKWSGYHADIRDSDFYIDEAAEELFKGLAFSYNPEAGSSFLTYAYRNFSKGIRNRVARNKKRSFDLDYGEDGADQESLLEKYIHPKYAEGAEDLLDRMRVGEVIRDSEALSDREGFIISRQFGLDGVEKTNEEMAEILGVTRARVGQIATEALRKLSESPVLADLSGNQDAHKIKDEARKEVVRIRMCIKELFRSGKGESVGARESAGLSPKSISNLFGNRREDVKISVLPSEELVGKLKEFLSDAGKEDKISEFDKLLGELKTAVAEFKKMGRPKNSRTI